MGASSKRKKEKRKDFQKPKLKVGKTKAKASNFTDTSFKAKSIVLTQQSLSTSAPSTTSQFDHHLSLLTSKNATQVRDSLAYLTTAVTAADEGHLLQPVTVIIPKVRGLIGHTSNGVRTQLLKLFQALPPSEVRPVAQELLLRIHAGMTNMLSEIRGTSLDILTWLLGTAGDQVVSCPGGWVKTLRCFLSTLTWNETEQTAKGGFTSTASSKSTTDAKLLSKTLVTLTAFLRAGLEPPGLELQRQRFQEDARNWFPLTHTHFHMTPEKSNPYAYLNLFGPPPDEDGASYEGYEERRDVFARRFQSPVQKGLEWARKEQGEVGRAAKGLEKALLDGLADRGGQR